MTAFKMVLAGGVAAAALVGSAPAAAQYYPNYGYNNGGGVVGQVIQQVLGQGQYGYGQGYGGNSQYAVAQCSRAVEYRVNRDYAYRGGGYRYGGYSGYPQGNARVLGVTSIEPRSNGRLRVRGVATANAYAGGYGNPYGGYGGQYGGYGGQYGGAYAGQYGGQYGYAQQRGELTFKCDIDYRGYINDIDVDRINYGYRRY